MLCRRRRPSAQGRGYRPAPLCRPEILSQDTVEDDHTLEEVRHDAWDAESSSKALKSIEALATNSTGHVQDRVCVRISCLQQFNGLGGWQDTQFDVTTAGLLLYFVHHWQSTRARTDNQKAAFPRYPLFCRERGVAKIIAEFLGRLLLSLIDIPTVNQHIVVAGDAIDSDGPERKRFKPHTRLDRHDTRKAGPHHVRNGTFSTWLRISARGMPSCLSGSNAAAR